MIYKKSNAGLFLPFFLFLSCFPLFLRCMDKQLFLVPVQRSGETLPEAFMHSLNVVHYTLSYTQDYFVKNVPVDQNAYLFLDASLGNCSYAVWCLNQIVHNIVTPEVSLLVTCRKKVDEISALFDTFDVFDQELYQKIAYLRSLIDYIKRGLFIFSEHVYPSSSLLPDEIHPKQNG